MIPNRPELVRLAIMARCAEIIDHHVRPVMPRSASFADGVVEICAITIDLVRHDPELANLVASVFADSFTRARESGEVRTDIDEDELNDWIRGVVLMILLRTDLEPHRERELPRSFLVPSLVHPRELLRRSGAEQNPHATDR